LLGHLKAVSVRAVARQCLCQLQEDRPCIWLSPRCVMKFVLAYVSAGSLQQLATRHDAAHF